MTKDSGNFCSYARRLIVVDFINYAVIAIAFLTIQNIIPASTQVVFEK